LFRKKRSEPTYTTCITLKTINLIIQFVDCSVYSPRSRDVLFLCSTAITAAKFPQICNQITHASINMTYGNVFLAVFTSCVCFIFFSTRREYTFCFYKRDEYVLGIKPFGYISEISSRVVRVTSPRCLFIYLFYTSVHISL